MIFKRGRFECTSAARAKWKEARQERKLADRKVGGASGGSLRATAGGRRSARAPRTPPPPPPPPPTDGRTEGRSRRRQRSLAGRLRRCRQSRCSRRATVEARARLRPLWTTSRLQWSALKRVGARASLVRRTYHRSRRKLSGRLLGGFYLFLE